jgi:hypothetical protein
LRKINFSNGQLHIYNADTGALISRKEAFIPMNMWLDHEAAEKDIARWKRIAAGRREWETRPNEIIRQQSSDYALDVLVTFHLNDD